VPRLSRRATALGRDRVRSVRAAPRSTGKQDGTVLTVGRDAQRADRPDNVLWGSRTQALVSTCGFMLRGQATPTSRASRRRADRADATTRHTIIHRHQRTPITTGRGSRTTSGTLQAGFEPATRGLGRAPTTCTTRSACDFHVPEVPSGRVTGRRTTLVRVTSHVTADPDHWRPCDPDGLTNLSSALPLPVCRALQATSAL
jgi:hypothetical protein